MQTCQYQYDAGYSIYDDSPRFVHSYVLSSSRTSGKERDTESGLDYFGARYYGSSMGRFMSPDDGSDQQTDDPQSWNLYSYVRNNPLIRTDPSGQDCLYMNGDGTGYLLRGDCASDTDSGVYVNGHVDENSFRYNPANNSSSFSYTPDGAGPDTIGRGVLQGPNLNGGFEPGSLAAGVFGAGSASTWNNSAGVVNAAGTAELTAASLVSTPRSPCNSISRMQIYKRGMCGERRSSCYSYQDRWKRMGTCPRTSCTWRSAIRRKEPVCRWRGHKGPHYGGRVGYSNGFRSLFREGSGCWLGYRNGSCNRRGHNILYGDNRRGGRTDNDLSGAAMRGERWESL